MRAALIACSLFWCLLMLAWIIHDVNRTCGNDFACKVQMEAP